MALPPIRLALAACLVGGIALGADPTAPALREKVLVRLIQIDLLATDNLGRPVTDLTPDDLVLKEDGREQKIAFLERHARAAAAVPVPRATLHLEAPDREPARPVAGREPRWFVLFFDPIRIEPRGREQVRLAARQFVETRMQDHDRVAVVVFDGTLHLEQNFSASKDATLAAIDRAHARSATYARWEMRIRELSLMLKDCQTQMARADAFAPGRDCMAGYARDYVNEHHAEIEAFIGAIDLTARILAGPQGRKFLFLFSHGVSLDPALEATEVARGLAGTSQQIADLRWEIQGETDHRDAFYAAIDRASRGGISVFTLDGSPQPTADDAPETRNTLRVGARPYGVAFTNARDGLEEIARNTGGKFYGDSKHLANLEQALDATQGAYTAGYYPDPKRPPVPGDELKISVKSKRKGVRISTRNRYVVPPPAAGVALLARFEIGAREALLDGRSRQSFSLILEPRGFTPLESGADIGLNFTLHVVLRTRDGLALAESYHFLNHAYPAAVWKEARERIVAPRFEGVVEAESGPYLLTAVVRDTQSGATQELSETIVLEPPAPTRPAS